jgi:uncharacterized phiE125 gp8 family phage protein
MRPILLNAPAIEPVSLADAKSWLRIESNDEDDLIQALIVAARMTLEAYTRRFFVTQTWRLVLDAWPASARAGAALALPFAPFQGVVAMRVFDSNDISRTAPAASYRAAAANDGARIVFVAAPLEPGRGADGIEIDIVVGYGGLAQHTPEPLRRAILMLTANWYENRGDDAANGALPPAAVALAAPFRRERL